MLEMPEKEYKKITNEYNAILASLAADGYEYNDEAKNLLYKYKTGLITKKEFEWKLEGLPYVRK